MASGPRASIRKQARRWLLAIALTLAASVAVGLGLAGLFVGTRMDDLVSATLVRTEELERRAEAAWAADLAAAGPTVRQPTPANESADALAILAAPMGIDLRLRAPGGEKPPPGGRFPDRPFGRDASSGDWLDLLAESSMSDVPPPPPDVTAFLDAHADAIDQVIAHLRSAPPPSWGRDPKRCFEVSVPWGGLHRLQRVLLARTYAHLTQSAPDAAGEALDASWRVAETLRGQGLLAWTLRVRMVHRQLSALRRIEQPSSPWPDRLAMLTPENDLRGASATEAACILLAGPGFVAGLIDDSRDPNLGRRWAALAALELHSVLGEVQHADACSSDPVAVAEEAQGVLPPFHIMTGLLVPDLGRRLRWLRLTQIDIALTQRVLELRAAHEAGTLPPTPGAVRPAHDPGEALPLPGLEHHAGATTGRHGPGAAHGRAAVGTCRHRRPLRRAAALRADASPTCGLGTSRQLRHVRLTILAIAGLPGRASGRAARVRPVHDRRALRPPPRLRHQGKPWRRLAMTALGDPPPVSGSPVGCAR
jgi:hypothetical protein